MQSELRFKYLLDWHSHNGFKYLLDWQSHNGLKLEVNYRQKCPIWGAPSRASVDMNAVLEPERRHDVNCGGSLSSQRFYSLRTPSCNALWCNNKALSLPDGHTPQSHCLGLQEPICQAMNERILYYSSYLSFAHILVQRICLACENHIELLSHI